MRARVALVAGALLALALAAAVASVGWVFSDRVLKPQPYGLQPEFEIVDAGEGTVTLPAPPEDPPQFARTEVEGVYGLRYRGGAGRLGEVRSGAREPPEGAVVRDFELEEGRAPRPGDPARIDVTVYRNDPEADHGLAFEAVTVDAPVGPVPAWWLDAGGETAVLMLHGRRRADRTETLRSLPSYREAGASVLVASYRNHDAAPPSPDGLYHYGRGEAEDARAALAFLAERGVRRVVLVGFSMGATVAVELLRDWPADAPEPLALVMEAPLVDVRSVVRHAARREDLPLAERLADLALWVGRLRTGVAWDRLDLRRAAPALDLPVLLITGTDDGTVPVALVDELAARLPRLRRYLRLDGVEHMEAWNDDPARYRAAVTGFLEQVVRR